MAKGTSTKKIKDEIKIVDAPQTLSKSRFFKRLSFDLSEEQIAFRDAIYDKNISCVPHWMPALKVIISQPVICSQVFRLCA